ncbi:MAG: tetratricopeptide repeat protein [Bacillota bacterium]
MRWFLGSVLAVGVLGPSANSVHAFADSRAAYDMGKAAYQAGDFERAREQFLSASQTDPSNPEALLWLGKSYYQLGALNEAMAAWDATLKLTPNEPYSARMLAALRGQFGQADTTSALIDALLREHLYDPALLHAQKLLADKALTDVQRAKAMLQRAAALLGCGRVNDVPPAIQEILARYPKLADPAQTTLLLGQAYVRIKGEKTDEGLALLKKLVAQPSDSAAAAIAQLELSLFELDQAVNPARVEALAKWIAGNPQHPRVAEARMRLVDAYLAAANQSGVPRAESPLAKEDAAAIQVAAEIYKQTFWASDAQQLTQRLIKHLDERYLKNRSYFAAVSAADALLKAPLPRSSRIMALRASARYRTELALQQLAVSMAATGGAGMQNDPLPQSLVDMLSAMNQEFPSEPIWRDQAALAERLRQLGTGIPWPARLTEPKAPQAWAVQIALPVIKANGDESAVAEAINTIANIAIEIAKVEDPKANALAASINGRLLSAMSTEHREWIAVAQRQANLLAAAAKIEFEENEQANRAGGNAKLSATQQQLLAVLSKIAATQASQADQALKTLTSHLQPWIGAGHYKAAEDAYAQLLKALPATQQKIVRLAIARLWIEPVLQEHARLTQAGLAPARQLDPTLQKAIEELYTLHQGLSESDPLIVELRNVWDQVVKHYEQLEYFDVAENALAVKAAQAVASADAHAQLQLAGLRVKQAQRELDRLLKQHDAARKLTMTPAWQAAIATYEKFITDYPTSPFIDQATSSLLGIAKVFQDRQAYDVAAGLYADISVFAAKQKVLAPINPAGVSVADRAAVAAASTLDLKARQALAKTLSERKPGTPPPAKISDEFVAAIGAYKEFIKSRPNSPILGSAIRQISSIANEYAQADAWDAAGSIYADLLATGLPLRGIEQLEFSLASCQLGKAMPEHARQTLAALIVTPPVPASSGMSAGSSGGIAGLASGDSVTKDELVAVPITLPKPTFVGVPHDLPAMGVMAKSQDAAKADVAASVAINQIEGRRAAQVASLSESARQLRSDLVIDSKMKPQAEQIPVLSEAELKRLDGILDGTYKAFTALRSKYSALPIADQSRREILLMIAHWRSLQQWQRSAAMAQRYLADNPNDAELAAMRLQIAHDYLTFAAQLPQQVESQQAVLAELGKRFEQARAELARFVADFPDLREPRQQAQWDIAMSFLIQARTVATMSPTLARGQYVRAARELQRIATQQPEHPSIPRIPQTLAEIATELAGRAFFDEALLVWNDLANFDPISPLAQQAAPQIAATYQNNLNRPLRAVEAYLEINFARGGSDQASQNAIFQIGSHLKDQKRWVEALSVLETFVDSFPRHPNAGQALTLVGQIHQINEAWQDAITAYRRVINEYPSGSWVQEAKWSIAECTINLSQWREAVAAYEAYVAAYAKDGRVAEANRRMGILKDLSRYQTLVDEAGQRKSFDAQFQIASIIQTQLANPQKAIIEYRKVATNWPQSHLADDALYAIGTLYLSMGETDKGRESLLNVAIKYPDSNLADDALYQVGKSYEDESQKLAGLTRGDTEQLAQETAQRQAYAFVREARDANRFRSSERIQSLKKGGKAEQAELEEAKQAGSNLAWSSANFDMAINNAAKVVQTLTAAQLADRQDKMNAALRKAVEGYAAASRVPGADKAGDALLRMAVIYDEQLKDSQAALAAWQEIVRQFSGNAVAEEASWRIAQYYDRAGNWGEAVEAYKAFLRNYRRSPKAGQAQFSIAEGYEHLNKWVEAMDAYTNYLTNCPDGPLAGKAKEQINWIKTYRL